MAVGVRLVLKNDGTTQPGWAKTVRIPVASAIGLDVCLEQELPLLLQLHCLRGSCCHRPTADVRSDVDEQDAMKSNARQRSYRPRVVGSSAGGHAGSGANYPFGAGGGFVPFHRR